MKSFSSHKDFEAWTEAIHHATQSLEQCRPTRPLSHYRTNCHLSLGQTASPACSEAKPATLIRRGVSIWVIRTNISVRVSMSCS